MNVALFAALNAADAALTVALVARGAANEGNPLMAAVLALGPAAFVVVKVASSAVLGALTARRWPSALRALCWAFSAIVVWNAAQLVLYNAQ